MTTNAYRTRSHTFEDRVDAGRKLASLLRDRVGSDVVVLGLPRGGVPVAREISRTLGAPLDVLLVRKLGSLRTQHPQLARGAIASGGVRVFDDRLLRMGLLRPSELELVILAEQEELERRERLYRRGRDPVPVSGRTVVLVDDGLAMGATMRAGIDGLRSRGAKKVIAAVPVAAPETRAVLERHADEAVFLVEPKRLTAVGRWYRDFRQTSDGEVELLIADANESRVVA